MAEDPYKVLGVQRDAADDDIRKAYRKLAKELIASFKVPVCLAVSEEVERTLRNHARIKSENRRLLNPTAPQLLSQPQMSCGLLLSRFVPWRRSSTSERKDRALRADVASQGADLSSDWNGS